MKKFLLLTILIALCLAAYTQNHESLGINNVKTQINPSNRQFLRIDSVVNNNNYIQEYLSPSFEFPANSGKTILYSMSHWLAAENMNNQKFVSADRYFHHGQEFVTGPLDDIGNIHQDTIIKYKRLWTLTKAQIDSFIDWTNPSTAYQNYQPPEAILSWPAGTVGNPLAPFVDVNNDNRYRPLIDGDYPRIKGDKAIYFILNDVGGNQAVTGNLPLKIEIHCMFYAFNCPNSNAINNTIFANFKYVNHSQYIYEKFKPSLFADYDLKLNYQDLLGTDVQSGLTYFYDHKNAINTIYGDTSFAAGIVLLKGPKMSNNQKDDSLNSRYGINGSGFEDGIIDNEYYGLTNNCYSFNGFTINNNYLGDPYTSTAYFNRIHSKLENGIHMQYGGIGFDTNTVDCSYMFPGNTDPDFHGTGFQIPPGNPVWKDGNLATSYHDKRLIISTRKNYLFPGESCSMDIAMVNALQYQDNTYQVVSLLQSYADSLQYYFHNNINPCGSSLITGNPEVITNNTNIKIYPNPAKDILNIQTTFNNSYTISVYSLTSQLYYKRTITTTDFRLHINDLQAGLYIIHITDGEQSFVRKIVKN